MAQTEQQQNSKLRQELQSHLHFSKKTIQSIKTLAQNLEPINWPELHRTRRPMTTALFETTKNDRKKTRKKKTKKNQLLSFENI